MDERLLPGTTIGWSRAGVVTRADDGAEAVLGRAPALLVGLRLAEALGISAADAERLIAHAAQGARGPSFVHAELRGRQVALRITSAPRPDGDFASGVVDLDQLLDGAPPVQLSRVSSLVSHELRNPLSSIKMAVQTLARNATLSERDQRRLTIANKEIRTMERMLWVFSEYGRDSAPHLEPVAVRALVDDARSLIEPELAEAKSSLEIEERGGPLPPVRVDRARLKPVLGQLLLSAASDLPEGAPVRVTIERDGGRVAIRILHAELVLTAEEQEKLFEPFPPGMKLGAGLGLAALLHVVESVGGTVTAAPTGDKGVVFTVALAG